MLWENTTVLISCPIHSLSQPSEKHQKGEWEAPSFASQTGGDKATGQMHLSPSFSESF